MDEFTALAELGVTDIVSLLEVDEAKDLGLDAEGDYCNLAGIRFHSFPVPDRGLPSSVGEFGKLACALYHQCAGGRHFAIHCRAGIGRSGLLSAAVLLHCGHEVTEAFSTVSQARGVDVPDTGEQANWLKENQDAVRQFWPGNE